MQVEIHRDHRLEGLRAGWDTLFGLDLDATPFLAHGWAHAWLEHWARDARPWVVTVHDAGELIGLAPFALRRRGPLRTLIPLGSTVGNYWDVLARPAQRSIVNRAVALELARRRGEWDGLLLDTLPPSSSLRAHLARVGLHVRRRGARMYPGFALPASFDDYLARLPRSRRSDLRQHLRPVRRGELALVEVRDPAALGHAASAWQDIRARWWRARGKELNPDHRRPAFGAFVAEMLRRLVPLDLAVAWELRRGDELVGVSVNLCDDRTFYCWLSGFEPAAARLGPGKVVIAESIRASIAKGRSYYDFMVGGEPYKYWFGGTDREVARVLVSSGRPRSTAVSAAALAKDRLRVP